MLFHVSVWTFPKITRAEGRAGVTRGLPATCPCGHIFIRIKVNDAADR